MNNIEDIVSDLKKGRMVILVDDEDRENEGDLLIAADHVTPEYINSVSYTHLTLPTNREV